MSTQEQLEEERRIIHGATPAPWQEITIGDLGYTFWGVDGEPDVEHVADGMALVDLQFIAHARTALPQRNAQLQAVLELHEFDSEDVACGNPRHTNFDVGCPDCYHPCQGCGESYPCQTVRAIEEDGQTTAHTPLESTPQG